MRKSNRLSLISCILISVALIAIRLFYIDYDSRNPIKVTTWDALGYYIYLPSLIIYNDATALEWVQAIDQDYAVTGGTFYQATMHENGNYVFKYLGGVAIIQLPFFLIGHIIALTTDYQADGFSPPYQFSLAFGLLFICLLSIFWLRTILLRYFNDLTVAITLILLLLASNFIQYVSIEAGFSHGFIFPLYVAVIYTTIKWHDNPSFIWAALTGLIIGLATISRPTEAIMLFIPLLWNTHSKEAAKEKWQIVRQNLHHVLIAIFFGFIAVLPQLLYWKYASGSFVYDVGSKWDFLNPHFRVLFGWEKGWFIYTPITIFFVLGLFFIKKYPFKNAILTFCLLNIYIIIAWSVWRYGGSYSTRALVQSYPVFALPLAAVVQRIIQQNYLKYGFYLVAGYLLIVNLFQIWQFNYGIIHYDHMNRKYYSAIYLDPSPEPVEMSLLDTEDYIKNESSYKTKIIIDSTFSSKLDLPPASRHSVFNHILALPEAEEQWLKIEINFPVEEGLWESYLIAEVGENDLVKKQKIRLYNPLTARDDTDKYAFYLKIPDNISDPDFSLSIGSFDRLKGNLKQLKITLLAKDPENQLSSFSLTF